ncbi:hypothetical protein ACFQ46_02240 [Kineococcus sp. GCM10028916]|uniref:hypothetical protein n=1 Tax=Kineococcus sp. GCM10028916 TaxID=3273394 RepID=UPI00362E6648
MDVIGERNGLWVRFNQGITRAEAEERLTAFRFGSPNVTWRLIRRTTSTVEELIDIPPAE